MKYIYGLVDPRNRQIRYVGQSNDPERRYQQHVSNMEDTPKGLWIQELRTIDRLPEFILIDECEDNEAFYLENWWIILGRRQGWPLTNGTNPGEWRAQDDFKQLFDEHLKAMEEQYKQSLERIENNHKLVCESMEMESAKIAVKHEKTRWEIKLSYFMCAAVLISILISCAFFILVALGNASRMYYAICISLSLLGYGGIALYTEYIHVKMKRSNEDCTRSIFTLIGPYAFIVLGFMSLFLLGQLTK